MPRRSSSRTVRPRKVRKPLSRRAKTILGLLLVAVMAFAALYHYRKAILFYIRHSTQTVAEDDKMHAVRNFQVMSRHEDLVVGFDVSQYQGDIDWFLTDSIDGRFPLNFVFIRATAGKDAVDEKFRINWDMAAENGFMRGAYHYYRPNENSLEQAKNFIKTVTLKKGDLPPVLDIEKLPKHQSIDSLKLGLKRWLRAVEKHYKVKPIIYSGESYYNDFLRDEFAEYVFWIANYNFFVEEIDPGWTFWQFTERARVKGIETPIDVNIFNGSEQELEELVIP